MNASAHKQIITDYFEASVSAMEIAKRHGISLAELKNIIHAARGYLDLPHRRQAVTKNTALKRQAIAMLKDGKPANKVAHLCGVSVRTVYAWKKQAGL